MFPNLLNYLQFVPFNNPSVGSQIDLTYGGVICVNNCSDASFTQHGVQSRSFSGFRIQNVHKAKEQMMYNNIATLAPSVQGGLYL